MSYDKNINGFERLLVQMIILYYPFYNGICSYRFGLQVIFEFLFKEFEFQIEGSIKKRSYRIKD